MISPDRAVQLWESHQYDDSLRLFEQKARKTKSFQDLLNYAYALDRCGQTGRSEKLYSEIIKISSSTAVIRMIIERLLYLRRLDRALPYLELLATRKAISKTEGLQLIEAYDRTNRKEKAQNLLDSHKQKHGHCAAYANLAGSFACQEGDMLRGLDWYGIAKDLATPDEVAERQAAAHGQAKCLESLERYEESVNVLAAAKQESLADPTVETMRHESLQEARSRLEWVRSLESNYFQRILTCTRAEGNHPHSILMTGFPRSGTTLFEQMLLRNSLVHSADETTALSARIRPLRLIRHGQLLDPMEQKNRRALQKFYFDCVEGIPGTLKGRVLVDKNPSLISQVPEFLDLLPWGQVLFCLRNPLDVMVSCYTIGLSLNPFSVHFLRWDWLWEWYQLHMEILLELRQRLPQDSWKELRYEQLVDNPQDTTMRTMQELGIESGSFCFKDGERPANANRFVSSPTYADVRRPVHRNAMDRWKHYASAMEAAGVPMQHALFDALGYP